MSETDPLVHWARRAAAKRFDPTRSVPSNQWESILRAIELAPSSYGLQPYRVVEIRDPARRRKLRAACYDQPQLVESDRFLVFAVATDFGKAHLDAHLARTPAAPNSANAISNASDTRQLTAAESAPPLKETTKPCERLLRR